MLVAPSGEVPGAAGRWAVLVDADAPGFTFGDPIEFIAEHPAASMTFADCRIPADALIGEQGQGFKVAMGVFDIFRPSVGAAAVGLARRALEETLARVSTRTLFGQTLRDLKTVKMML